ncbi:sporulation protein YjcZ (plasmid) [Deinococcus wulumuqiensis]|uniref:Sporulation protein YjcZ n=1 Tax=Deinococcus wulumuqiensis TaxID=980427 RepID=A0A345IN61_9DEIO|nr:sporulation protein YjcZ [Deinococcus wulumuqiensis]
MRLGTGGCGTGGRGGCGAGPELLLVILFFLIMFIAKLP